MENKISLPLIFGFFICFLLAQVINHRIQLHPPKDDFLLPPPEYIEYFDFGFREAMADSFWLRWIQDSGNCQTYLKPVVYLHDNSTQSESGDGRFTAPRHKICDSSWAFKMLDAVTKLAPRYRMAYVAGGIMLAVVTEDYAGSTLIFDRGVAQFPDDWDMLYRASFHFLFDVGDKEKAAKLLVRAGQNGAPYWVNSLAARLYTETGQLELGIRTLEDFRKTLDNPLAIKDTDKRLAELRARYARAAKH